MMRKLGFILYLVLLLQFPVKGADFQTTLTGNTTVTTGSAFHITAKVENGDNITAIIAELSYDTSKLKLVSSVGLNQYSILVGSNILADHLEGKSGTFGFVDFTFQTLSNFKDGEKTTISLSNVSGSNGNEDLSGVGSSITISAIRPKSSNTNLSIIWINGEALLNFNPSQTNYTITVESTVESVIMNAKADDSNSTIKGLGKKQLEGIETIVPIVVTSEDGHSKTYTIKVIKEETKTVTTNITKTADNSSSKEKKDVFIDKKTISEKKKESPTIWFYLTLIEAVIIFITILILILLSFDYKKMRKILDN